MTVNSSANGHLVCQHKSRDVCNPEFSRRRRDWRFREMSPGSEGLGAFAGTTAFPKFRTAMKNSTATAAMSGRGSSVELKTLPIFVARRSLVFGEDHCQQKDSGFLSHRKPRQPTPHPEGLKDMASDA
jgi:hypothetical protein